MASSEKDNFESDWTFVNRDGSVHMKPRASSVLYSKSAADEDHQCIQFDFPSKNDSEGEVEFEVLSGFQCCPLPETESGSTDGLLFDGRTKKAEEAHEEDIAPDEEVSSQESLCQCSSDDGIMIISAHFCVEKDSSTPDSVTDPATVVAVLTDEAEKDHNLSLPSVSSDALDGWKELPQLSESGSLSFGSELSHSDEDAGIEPIPDDDGSQYFIDLSHEANQEVVESLCSVFSFDSDLFNPSEADEDVGNTQDLSDIEEVQEEDIQKEEKKMDAIQDCVIERDDNDDTFLQVDLPTLFVLLGLTTALGFSFGYGLSIYYSNRALTLPGRIKRPGPNTASLPLTSNPMEPLNDLEQEIFDKTTMWKLEDRLGRESETDVELGDLFDTKLLHARLQQKHFKLMNLHENVKQRLHLSKVMSWYWRLKYEEKRARKEDDEWSKYLQAQLKQMEALYLKEKLVADMWRRKNINKRMKQTVTGGIKFDKYWKGFLNRWKKREERGASVGKENVTLTVQESTSDIADNKEQTLRVSKKARQSMREYDWLSFKVRWTTDAQGKGSREGLKNARDNCASEVDKEKYLDAVFGYNVLGKGPKSKTSRRISSVLKQAVDQQCRSFTEVFQFDNPLFPRKLIPSENENLNPAQLSKTKQLAVKDKRNQLIALDSLKETFRQVLEDTDGTDKQEWIGEDAIVSTEANKEKTEGLVPTLEDVNKRVAKSYVDIAKKKCGQADEFERTVEKEGKVKKEDAVQNRTEIWSKELNLSGEKQKLRNLSRVREEEIRKQRIQRRELKKEERETAQRVKNVEKLLFKLQEERRRIEKEKKVLRRSWDVFKQEKRNLTSEKELHRKSKKDLKNFIKKLKLEKQSLRNVKGKLEKQLKKTLGKEMKNFRQMKKRLELEKKKEVDRIRKEISGEKKALRKEQKELRYLKQAAKEEYKKWLVEFRKIKRKEKQRKKKSRAKRAEKIRKKGRRADREEIHRKRQHDAFIKEQMKFDREKRRKKAVKKHSGNYAMEEETDSQRAASRQEKEEFARQSEKEETRKHDDREYKFRKQLEQISDWLVNIHGKGSVQEKLHEQRGRYEGINENERKESERSNEAPNSGKKELSAGKFGENIEIRRQSNMEETTVKQPQSHNRQRDKNKNDIIVRKSSLALTSENKAVADYSNFTFNVDLDEGLLRRLQGRERKDKNAKNGDVGGRGNEAQVSVEPPYKRKEEKFIRKSKPSDRKPLVHKYWYKQEMGEVTSTEGPIPPKDTVLMIDNWCRKRLEVNNARRNNLPKGPITFGHELRDHTYEGRVNNFRKEENIHHGQSKMFFSSDSEKGFENLDPIPPPEWIFDRAKGRADQRAGPWYERRAEDRIFYRNTDQHESHLFGRNPKCKRLPRARDASWIFERASDRAEQRLNNEPWYNRRAEGREELRRENVDTWLIERGRYRKNVREWNTWYEDRYWMPRGPSMDEHR